MATAQGKFKKYSRSINRKGFCFAKERRRDLPVYKRPESTSEIYNVKPSC